METTIIKPFIEENFFTEEEFDLIYKNVYGRMKKGLDEKNDKYAYLFRFKNNGFITMYQNWDIKVIDAVRKRGSKLLGDLPVTHDNYALIFARYTHESGGRPNLAAHVDDVVNSPTATVTIRLKSTLDWDIYVADDRFEHPTNAGLWMSGNQQPHWRPDKEFGVDDYYDILLCQVWSDKSAQFEPGHRDNMLKLEQEYVDKYRHLQHNSHYTVKEDTTDCIGITCSVPN